MIPALAILIILCQFIDFATTYRILKNGGVESNPIVKKLMDIFGMELGLFLAKFYAGAFVLEGAMLGWFESESGLVALFSLAVLYVVVCVHNLRQIKRG